ncbi:homoserine O-acetyltransferase/O-succinyltransferase family protein [Limosilactobacillus equigenerosi]|uniref:Homoserine O-acetyltransferase n=1 Tax=Limosilactobacillus equigenerosi DSM 18793 = JCM 14505 TaxID=1423742 RepID=A0A0R1UZ15_9LACO|nr:homoserine O-succinyltransferase [Limosilactobacillus equigenerosi]KRL96082.1 homoserine O-succinyltransferase [Limosilactobacillus equigenerosi DSM 18793 = JCM 14505]
MTANASNGFLLQTHRWINHVQTNPLKLAIVNLMPTKLATERQFLTQFNRLDTDVEITFVYPVTHKFKGTPRADIQSAYTSLATIAEQHFDGVIITGAPVEHLPFEQVDYWDEFQTICDWAEHHAHQTLLECWAAQAGLFNDFGIPKQPVKHKVFGVYQADTTSDEFANCLGAGGLFKMPQSRHTTSLINPTTLPNDIAIVASNHQIGPLILHSRHHRRTYVTGHPEYEKTTLNQEYERDLKKHLPIQPPLNYFQANGQIDYSWQSSSQTFYQTWLNQTKKAGN